MKKLTDLIGLELELKEMPNLRFGNPNIKIGNIYKIIDAEGSNLWIFDDDGHKTSVGSCRFILP